MIVEEVVVIVDVVVLVEVVAIVEVVIVKVVGGGPSGSNWCLYLAAMGCPGKKVDWVNRPTGWRKLLVASSGINGRSIWEAVRLQNITLWSPFVTISVGLLALKRTQVILASPGTVSVIVKFQKISLCITKVCTCA